jgi:hypothetical protein
MIDPSNSTKNVIHFMLPKPAVIQIAEMVNDNGEKVASNRLMEFALSPSSSMSGMNNMASM